MYEEKKIKIPFRDIALQILIIVLFVLILLWLFPTKKNMKDYVEDNNTNNTENSEKIDNNNSKNTNKNSKSTSKDKQNDNKKTAAKQYEYAKTSEGTYGDYGEWSDWSTNYVAASDTVEVQTEVRSSVNGSKSYYEQTGTKKETNVVVGTKTNKNVVIGYNVKLLRDNIISDRVLENVGDYIYIFTGGERTYSCADGEKISTLVTTPKTDFSGMPYEQLINVKNDYSLFVTPSNCQNASIFSTKYYYHLYERVPIYTTTTEDIYGDKVSPVYEQKTDYSYGNVTYYRYRTRSYTAGAESIKWSNSENDETLIAQGYHFTGNVK